MDKTLKESILKHLEYQKSMCPDLTKPFIACPGVGKNSWTLPEIIEEVENETSTGEEFADSVIGLVIDILCRKKKN